MSIIKGFYLLESLEQLATNIFVILTLSFLIECKEAVIQRLLYTINSIRNVIKRDHLKKTIEKIETIIVEP